jgi:phosphoglycolate phosphatase-like HAD superfamily hydrolase
VDKQDAVIVDVDGTLCDVHGIRRLIDSNGFDAFHYASVNCPVHQWVVDKVRDYHRNGVAVLVVTGRSEKFRRLTSWYLAHNRIPSTGLWMRRNGDYRKDFVIKEEILRALRCKYNIIEAIDDNPAVIDLWEREGIPVTVVPGWDGPA